MIAAARMGVVVSVIVFVVLFTWAATADAKRTRWSYATASWYGPGLFGNPMGCGGRLYPGTTGVAHKSLPCGTKLRVCYRGCQSVRVVDRGPYVGGREFDLTQATRYAIGFPNGVARIRWRLR